MSATPLEPIIKAVAGVVRDHVQKAFDALNGRLKEIAGDIEVLKLEVATRPAKGEDGKSVTAEDVLPELRETVAELVKRIPAPKDGQDGKSITVEDVRPLIESKHAEWALGWERDALSRLERAVAAIPVPKDGREGIDGKDGRDGVDGKHGEDGLPGADGLNGKDGRDGIDGKDGAPGLHGKDGADGIDGKDGAPGLHGKDGADGVDGKDGADGVDGKSVTIEQIKELVDARTAEWQLDFEKRAMDTLQKAIDRVPLPKDGKDALSLKDLDIIVDDHGRRITFVLDDGQRREERTIVTALPVYREIWKKDGAYEPGDMVTWGGSIWIALKATSAQPNGYNPDWKLAVKRGKNGISPEGK